jgi:hypothetical protein
MRPALSMRDVVQRPLHCRVRGSGIAGYAVDRGDADHL